MIPADYHDHRRCHALERQTLADRRASERGYNFFMDSIVDRSPFWIRALEVLFRPSSVFSLGLLGLCVWLLVGWGG